MPSSKPGRPFSISLMVKSSFNSRALRAYSFATPQRIRVSRSGMELVTPWIDKGLPASAPWAQASQQSKIAISHFIGGVYATGRHGAMGSYPAGVQEITTMTVRHPSRDRPHSTVTRCDGIY